MQANQNLSHLVFFQSQPGEVQKSPRLETVRAQDDERPPAKAQ